MYGFENENVGREKENAVPVIPPRIIYDGKRMRKPIQRKTVDYGSTVIKYLESRRAYRDFTEYPAFEPHPEYSKDLLPPENLSPITTITTKFVHTSTNKLRCPINCVAWTPEGRRLITGSSSGEFTLWNGLTFNFETILQAHDSAVRAMVWSHNDNWMVTGDHGGFIKYWQSNMNNVKAFQAHKEAVRDISFCPTDLKFASCSDDVTLKIWDFALCKEEHVLTGHGWDVKAVDWHPQKSIVVSGSKDNLIKLWDAKSGKNINTLHGHKNTVLQVKWNGNGNWLVSASRDQLVKLFELRMMREMQTFRGHKKEVTALAWHPFHEDLLVSGGFDGSIIYWLVGSDDPQAEMIGHESSVWDLAWHPVGHILCSGSNDHTTKFWCRNRPGDMTKDKFITTKPDATNEDRTDIREKAEPPTMHHPHAPPGINMHPPPGLHAIAQQQFGRGPNYYRDDRQVNNRKRGPPPPQQGYPVPYTTGPAAATMPPFPQQGFYPSPGYFAPGPMAPPSGYPPAAMMPAVNNVATGAPSYRQPQHDPRLEYNKR